MHLVSMLAYTITMDTVCTHYGNSTLWSDDGSGAPYQVYAISQGAQPAHALVMTRPVFGRRTPNRTFGKRSEQGRCL